MSERAGADPGLTQVPGYLTHASGRGYHGLLWTWSELFSNSLKQDTDGNNENTTST